MEEKEENMTDEEAKKYIEEFEKNNPPENYMRENGSVDAYSWEKKLLEVLCEDFGDAPSENENHIITEERRSLKTDLYTYERHHTNVKDFQEELNIKRLQEEHEKEMEVLNKIMGKYDF